MATDKVIGSAEYKGKKYAVLFIGETKFGRRAHLAFFNGQSDFWVDASKVSNVRMNSAGGGSGSRDSGMVKCRNCGQKTPEGDDWCIRCGSADYEN